MRIAKRKWSGIASALGACCLAAAGCDSGGGGRPAVSTSKTEVSVTGKVTIKGQPASGGSVTFDASNIDRKDVQPKTAEIGADGKYSIKTYPGDNGVIVNVPGSAAGFRGRHEVTEGENTFDIEVETAPAPK